jgi:hypothetical protein
MLRKISEQQFFMNRCTPKFSFDLKSDQNNSIIGLNCTAKCSSVEDKRLRLTGYVRSPHLAKSPFMHGMAAILSLIILAWRGIGLEVAAHIFSSTQKQTPA